MGHTQPTIAVLSLFVAACAGAAPQTASVGERAPAAARAPTVEPVDLELEDTEALADQDAPVGDETAAEPVVQGSLRPQEIRTVIRENIDEVRACYNAGLASDPSLEGRVSVRFTISDTGAVASTSIVGDTVESQAVASCVSERVRTWVFPRPRGGGVVVVSYPFLLTPESTIASGAPAATDSHTPNPATQASGGRLSRSEIVRVIRRDQAAVRQCYESELVSQPGLSGRVVFRFRIAETGRVSSADVVSNTVGSSKVAMCVATRVLSWQFPRPSAGAMTVSYPFSLRPSP